MRTQDLVLTHVKFYLNYLSQSVLTKINEFVNNRVPNEKDEEKENKVYK